MVTEELLYLYIIVFIVLVVLFVVSLAIPFYGFMRKRFKGLLLGCVLQPIIFAIIASIILYATNLYAEHDEARHREGAMVTLRQKTGNNPDSYERKWYLKPDGECFYNYWKPDNMKEESSDDDYDNTELYNIVPLDSFRVCVDDVITVSFDLKGRKVTAVKYNDSLEVVSVDWDKVEAYFLSQHSE